MSHRYQRHSTTGASGSGYTAAHAPTAYTPKKRCVTAATPHSSLDGATKAACCLAHGCAFAPRLRAYGADDSLVLPVAKANAPPAKVLFRGRPSMGRVQRPIFRDSVRDCPQRMYTAVRWQVAVNSGFSWPLGFAGFHNALVSMCRESHQWLMHKRVYGRTNRRWPANRKTAAAGAQVLRFENGWCRQAMPCCVDARGI